MMRGTRMRRTIRTMFGGTLGILCLVSTLALAQSPSASPSLPLPSRPPPAPAPRQSMPHGEPKDMTCTHDDKKGHCVEAADKDGQVVKVVADETDDVKTGDPMTCVDTGHVVQCAKMAMQ